MSNGFDIGILSGKFKEIALNIDNNNTESNGRDNKLSGAEISIFFAECNKAGLDIKKENWYSVIANLWNEWNSGFKKPAIETKEDAVMAAARKNGYNPELKIENSQITYSKKGVEYNGNNYSVQYNGYIITVINKDKNNEKTELDLNYLLREIENPEQKSRLMAAIQKFPGEAIVDMANEISTIRTGGIVSRSEPAYYKDDTITITRFGSLNDNNELSKILLHELGHAIEDHSRNRDDVQTENGENIEDKTIEDVRKESFDKETKKIERKFGKYTNNRDYTEVLVQKNALKKETASAYGMKNEHENFAERYVDIMTGGEANSTEILERYKDTGNKQTEHILSVKNSQISDRMEYAFDPNPNSHWSIYTRKLSESIELENKMVISKDEKNPNQYTLTIYQKDDETKPLKIIKFNSDAQFDNREYKKGEMYELMSKEIPNFYGEITEIIEYSATEPAAEYKTIFENGKPVRIK